MQFFFNQVNHLKRLVNISSQPFDNID